MANDVIKTLIAEALGEGPEGMRMVAETILNRAAIRGLSPEQVVRQRHQYTGLRSPGRAAKLAWKDPNAIAAAEAAFEEALGPDDPTGGADHYFAPGTISTPYWARGMVQTAEDGGHRFFASRPIPPGSLPSVGTALDVERVAPTPSIPSIAAAQLRGFTSPTGGNTDLQTALNAEAGRRATAIGNRVQPHIRSIAEALPTSASDRSRGKTPVYSITEGGRAPAGLAEPGNLNLNARKVYLDGEGGYRTENSMSIGTDRGEALIPTVVNGRQLSADAAIQHYLDTGENLGMFKTPEAADRYAENLHLRQEKAYVPKAVAPEANLTSPGAINSIIAASRQDTTLAAALEQRMAPRPVASISDRLRGSEPQTRNAATTIASIPTSAPTLAYFSTAAQLPPIAPSTIGQPPTTRVVPTQPVVRQNTNIATARAEQASQRQPVTSLPSISASASPTRPQSIIKRDPQPSYPDLVRSIASMETTQRRPAAMDLPARTTSWGDFNQAMAKQPVPISLGNVMTSQAPRVDGIGSSSAWSDFTGTMAPRLIVAQPNAAPKGQEKLGGPQQAALAISPQLEVQIPTRQQLDAAGFKTVTQDKRITNPAWTAYRAANPAQTTGIGSPVPLGEMTYGVSRDSKGAVLAGQNFASNKMPAQFITVKEQVRVPVVAAAAPVARQTPLAVVPRVAPVPVSPFAPNVAQNPIMGLLNAITGQRGPNTLLSSILGAPAAGPAVGSFLGTAANGGQMIQGFNGVKNSTTQESDAWKRATGQSSYGSGQSNDTRYESYF